MHIFNTYNYQQQQKRKEKVLQQEYYLTNINNNIHVVCIKTLKKYH